jgi:PAS domain S-box-containing protein
MMLAPGADAHVVYVNGALLERLGLAAADVVGHSLPELLRGAHATRDLAPELAAGASACVELELGSAGARVILEWSLSPVRNDDAHLSQWFAVVRDVSAARAAAESRSESERLQAVALVVAGMAHEINNPLASITSNLEWLAATLPKLRPNPQSGVNPQQIMGSVSSALVDALAGAERVETTLANLTLLLGLEYSQREIADVRLLLEEALRELEPLFSDDVTVQRDYAEVPPVFIGERRLKQAFSSLIANGVQAISADSAVRQITVRTRFDERVRIEIEDTGSGVPEDLAPRLFRPFVTTRPPGAGKGLGLYLAKRIVESASGAIGFSSREGGGTTFFIELPPASASKVFEATRPGTK